MDAVKTLIKCPECDSDVSIVTLPEDVLYRCTGCGKVMCTAEEVREYILGDNGLGGIYPPYQLRQIKEITKLKPIRFSGYQSNQVDLQVCILSRIGFGTPLDKILFVDLGFSRKSKNAIGAMYSSVEELLSADEKELNHIRGLGVISIDWINRLKLAVCYFKELEMIHLKNLNKNSSA